MNTFIFLYLLYHGFFLKVNGVSSKIDARDEKNRAGIVFLARRTAVSKELMRARWDTG